MSESNVVEYKNSASDLCRDALSDFIGESAQKMLKEAIETEVCEFMESHKQSRLPNGSQSVVRNGYLPERAVQTGVGPVFVKVPRVRSRGEEEVSFDSQLIPKNMRRSRSLDVLLPLLYLKGVSTGDFQRVL